MKLTLVSVKHINKNVIRTIGMQSERWQSAMKLTLVLIRHINKKCNKNNGNAVWAMTVKSGGNKSNFNTKRTKECNEKCRLTSRCRPDFKAFLVFNYFIVRFFLYLLFLDSQFSVSRPSPPPPIRTLSQRVVSSLSPSGRRDKGKGSPGFPCSKKWKLVCSPLVAHSLVHRVALPFFLPLLLTFNSPCLHA